METTSRPVTPFSRIHRSFLMYNSLRRADIQAQSLFRRTILLQCPTMTHTLGIVADGRLFLVDENGNKTVHISDFGEDIERRMDRIAEKKAWKSQSGGGMFGQGDTWGEQSNMPRIKPRIEAVIQGHETNKFSCLLTTEAVGAFLEYDESEEYERRVFHKENFFANEFDRDPATGRLVCRFGREHEATQITILDVDGRDPQPLTEGDAQDGAPFLGTVLKKTSFSITPQVSPTIGMETCAEAGPMPSNASI